MRLADWDTATTAYYRTLWKRANEAHLPPVESSFVLTPYGLVRLDQLEEMLKERASRGDTQAAEVLGIVEQSRREHLDNREKLFQELAAKGSAVASKLIESTRNAIKSPIYQNYYFPRLMAKELKRRQKAGLILPVEGAMHDTRPRWRVLHALAGLLSTQPPIVPPEHVLRNSVIHHCEKTNQKLYPLRGRTRGDASVGSDEGQASPMPTPPPLEQHQKLWKQFQNSAETFEKEYGPASSLDPFLERLRAWKEPSEDQLLALWVDAVRLVQAWPPNPIPAKLLHHLDGERNRAKSYRSYMLPKRRGGHRIITTPGKSLKWVQRSLLQVLTHLFPRHKCAMGFERGESIVSHAKAHAGKRWVYVVDIKDFFPSITRNRLYGMMRARPFQASKHVARYLANLVTHEGALPQGAPTSPLLANLICRRLDDRLFRWARERGYQYTRYADDLAFSTNRTEFPEQDRERIVKIIEEEGFVVHPEKRKLMPWYGRQFVTGLVVNEKPNVPRAYVRSLRALLFNVKTFGWESQVGRRSIVFKDDAYLLYKRRAISYKDFRELEHFQRQHHALIHPGTRLARVHTVDQLRRVVRGKIAFVGAVKGKDSPVYLDLLQRYREALPEALAAAHALRRFNEARRKALRSYTPEAAPDQKPEDRTHHYRDFRAAMDEMLDGDAGREAILEWLEVRAAESLECRWLLRQALPTPELVKQAQQVAYALDTHPHETAQFFREFNTYRSFRGLLHAPSEQDGEHLTYPNGTVLTIGEIVGNCERAFMDRTLPNGLTKETERVIKACKKWLRLHPTQHPWLAADNATREVLLGYVYLTRFQPKLLRVEGLESKYGYENGRPLDFFARLQPFLKKLQGGQADRVHLGKRGLRFHLYTPPVRKAVEILIRNIVEKGFNAYVEMASVGAPRREEIKVIVSTDGGLLPLRPDFDELLGGDSQGVLLLLRGYANWTIEAPFEDDGVYQFDVMSAKSRPLTSTPAQPLPGLRHIITVYL